MLRRVQALGFVIAAVLCGCRGQSGGEDGDPSAGILPGVVQRAAEAARGPQVITDEEIAVDASGARGSGFTVPSSRRIKVLTEGVKHTDKGYNVYLMQSSEWDKFKGHKDFSHVPSFHGLKVRTFTFTDTVPAGSWMVVVENSENIFNTMVVHLKVVSDPG